VKARSVAQGGLLVGVSMMLLGLGSLFEIASGAAALLAALVPALFFLRGEASVGRLVYAATSLLAVLLLPDKFTALIYALVLGLYTAVRFSAPWHRKWVRLAWKAGLVVFWVLLSVVVIRLGLVDELGHLSPMILACITGGWTVFLIYYDFCMARIFAGMRRWIGRFHR